MSVGDRGWLAADADSAVTMLYEMHYRALVRIAALLLADVVIAEQVVQDSFVAMHSAWPRLPGGESASGYLYRSVVGGVRSASREHEAESPRPGHELGPVTVMSALRALPARQREVVVLRYFAYLSEAQIASAVGVTPGTVGALTIKAMTALETALGARAELIA
ncbi:MAG: sigma factor-like helix-turn-helix DNA-binding protein [Streptosporangiaceae bacterium]